jgi:hypothetical protein
VASRPSSVVIIIEINQREIYELEAAAEAMNKSCEYSSFYYDVIGDIFSAALISDVIQITTL